MRLDLFLVKNNFCESRNKATTLISSGSVSINGKQIMKNSYEVTEDDKVIVNSDSKIYVARSATKLITAIEKFGIDFNNKTVVDLGASTGGFCQVMLENNVRKIYAVDIGTSQLHPLIKENDKVVNLEHTNARYISANIFDEEIDIITCDLSFISLKLVLNSVMSALKENGEFICLVKPQFEVGESKIGKNGVVKNKKYQLDAVCGICDFAYDLGFEICDIAFSGLAGESGNREFLLYMKKSNIRRKLDSTFIEKVVLGD